PGLTADVLEQLGEDTAERFRGEGSRVWGGLFDRRLASGCLRFATRTPQRREAAPPARRDLVDETVALLPEALDLLDQELPLVAGLLQDLLRGVLGSRADLVGGAQRAREGVAYRGVELLVDRDALAGGIELRLERADSFGELADTVGKRSDDVTGRA